MPEIRRHLAALEAKGAVFRGRFSGAGAESWCDRYNLERIHRLTLEKVRAEIEPCEDHEYAAFVLRWHHIGGDGLPSGADGVAAVLDQLSGVALDTELWERAILPARVPDYRPEHLDLLCLSGQMVWIAVSGSGANQEVPSRIAFVPRGRTPVPLAGAENPGPEDPKQQIVLKVLRDGGALYLDQIAQRTELSDRDVLRALWSLAAEGCATNDSFAPIRLMASAPDVEHAIAAPPDRKLSRYDAGLRARLKSSLGGRWVAIDRTAEVERGPEWERELAMTAPAPPRNPDSRGAGRATRSLVVRSALRAAPPGIFRNHPARLFRAFAGRRAICAARGGRDAPRHPDRDAGPSHDGRLMRRGSG